MIDKKLMFFFLMSVLSSTVSAEPIAGIANISFSQNPILAGSNVNASVQVMANYSDVFQIRVLVNGVNRWNYTVNFTGPGNTTINLTLNTSNLSADDYAINFTLYNSTGAWLDWSAEELTILEAGVPFIDEFSFNNQDGIMNTTVRLVNCGGLHYYLLFTINTTPYGNHTINCTGSGSFNFMVNISNLSSGYYIMNVSVHNMSNYLYDSVCGDFQLDGDEEPYFANITKSSYEIIQGNTLNLSITLANCVGPQYFLVFRVNATVYGNNTINCTGNTTLLFNVDVSNLSLGIYILNISLYNTSNALIVSTGEDFRIIEAGGSAGIYVKVTDPNGGEFLNGTNYTVRFNVSSNYGGPLAAYLFYDNDNDTLYQGGPITSGFVNISNFCTDPDNNTATTNNCSILWQFDPWMNNWTIYLGIEVKDFSTNNTGMDYSDGSFIVLSGGNYQPHVTVLDPNGGENASGLNYTIRFSVSDPEGDKLYANIFYDNNTNPNDNGNNSWAIASVLDLSNPDVCSDPDNTTATTNNCGYVWNIDSKLRGEWIYVGIMMWDNISYPNMDYSDAPFFANSTGNRAPALTILSPGSGSNITAGSLLVRFNVSDPDGDRSLYGGVNIDYDTDPYNGWNYSGRGWNHSIDCLDLDNDTRTSDNCSIRINLGKTFNSTLANLLVYVIDRTTDDYQYDLNYSQNITFAGVDEHEPVLVVTSPNGGEVINSTQYAITFNVSDADGNLMYGGAAYDNDSNFPSIGNIGSTVDLADPGTCTDLDDDTKTVNNCSITWNVNSSLNNQTLWVLVGVSDGDVLVVDYSDGNVTVQLPIYTLQNTLTVGWNLISIPLNL